MLLAEDDGALRTDITLELKRQGLTVTAVPGGIYALYWNPAGLAGLGRPVFGFSHQSSFEGLNHEFIGYAQPARIPGPAGWGPGRSGLAWGAGACC